MQPNLEKHAFSTWRHAAEGRAFARAGHLMAATVRRDLLRDLIREPTTSNMLKCIAIDAVCDIQRLINKKLREHIQ